MFIPRYHSYSTSYLSDEMAHSVWDVIKRIISSSWYDLCLLVGVVIYSLIYFYISFYFFKWAFAIPTRYLLLYPAWMLVNTVYVLYMLASGKEVLNLARRKADEAVIPVLFILALIILTPLVSLPICLYITGAISWKIVVKTPTLTVARLRNSTIYPSSELGPRQIRLLEIRPGRHQDQICCKLRLANLDQAQYDALSYTWGTGYRQHEIQVDGLSFYVGNNLYAALRHLRHLQETRVMWIDAICINQANIQERISQVKLMRRIYQQASTVVIWLGNPLETISVLG
jgi:hypothetical protein